MAHGKVELFFIAQLQVEMQTLEARIETLSRPKIRCMEANTTANGSEETMKNTMKNVGKEEWDSLKYYAKKRRQSVVLMGEKIDMILLQGKIRYEHWERQKVLSPGRKVAKSFIQEQVKKIIVSLSEEAGNTAFGIPLIIQTSIF